MSNTRATSDASGTAGKAGYTSSSADLERWLRRHIGQGFGAEALVQSMCQSGYDQVFAQATVAAALSAAPRVQARGTVPDNGAEMAAEQGTGKPGERAGEHASGLGHAGAQAGRNAAHFAGREIPILFTLAAPRVTLFQQLLTDAECDALVALARGRLARSPVINPDTGDENLIEARTSLGAMFQVGEHPLIERIEDCIAAVTGIAAERGEGLQILNYKPGGEYQPHYDFFNPQRPGEARQLKVGGQRVGTLVIYLNSPLAGGATAFPKLGLEVAPVKGNAVYFSYRKSDGALDERTLHAGLPVEAGEKWIATKWLNARTGPIDARRQHRGAGTLLVRSRHAVRREPLRQRQRRGLPAAYPSHLVDWRRRRRPQPVWHRDRVGKAGARRRGRDPGRAGACLQSGARRALELPDAAPGPGMGGRDAGAAWRGDVARGAGAGARHQRARHLCRPVPP
ncbi:prolyl 4-hydroxylase alpha subunit [Cupriavidus basilensis OR16]|uniref:Prolyl 4-hydroxylase alpha subunit n=1 Tax=Cupriavidus basilensis OR16 TaxID=1127483 RepID=H1SE97_9BURK|nr:prolyl 4-hydroxylase alpha subunit [Cupriavidus basilensis OR16]